MTALDVFLCDCMKEGKNELVKQVLEATKDNLMLTRQTFENSFRIRNVDMVLYFLNHSDVDYVTLFKDVMFNENNQNLRFLASEISLVEAYFRERFVRVREIEFRILWRESVQYDFLDTVQFLIDFLVTEKKKENSVWKHWILPTGFVNLSLDMVKLLVMGIDMGIVGESKKNLLRECVCRGDIVATEYLLSIIPTEEIDFFPICCPDMIQLFLAEGLEPNQICLDFARRLNYDYCTELLENALKNSFMEKQKAMYSKYCNMIISYPLVAMEAIKDGLNPNYIGEMDYTPMKMALKYHQLEVVRFLEKRGAHYPKLGDVVDLINEYPIYDDSKKSKLVKYLLDIDVLDTQYVEGPVVDEWILEKNYNKKKMDDCINQLAEMLNLLKQEVKISVIIDGESEDLRLLYQELVKEGLEFDIE